MNSMSEYEDSEDFELTGFFLSAGGICPLYTDGISVRTVTLR